MTDELDKEIAQCRLLLAVTAERIERMESRVKDFNESERAWLAAFRGELCA